MSWSVYGAEWRTVRLAVLARDDYRCMIRLSGCTTAATCVDHIIPLSEGGPRLDAHNLRAACGPCNTKRNNQRRAELARFALISPATSAPSREW